MLNTSQPRDNNRDATKEDQVKANIDKKVKDIVDEKMQQMVDRMESNETLLRIILLHKHEGLKASMSTLKMLISYDGEKKQ